MIRRGLILISRVFEIMKKKDRKLYLQYITHESVLFGAFLSIVGGFLDAYTFIGRGGVFANAQTGNIVLFGVYASQGEWGQALLHIPPILAFVLGVIIAESIKNKPLHFFMLDWKQIVLILEIIVLFIVGFIPNTVPNIVVNVTISFVTSVQLSAFRKLIDSPYSTTMSTGNLRAASQSAYIAFTQKDCKAAIKAICYFTIILAFIFGAFLGGLVTLSIGVKAIWVAAIILLLNIILFNIGERR